MFKIIQVKTKSKENFKKKFFPSIMLLNIGSKTTFIIFVIIIIERKRGTHYPVMKIQKNIVSRDQTHDHYDFPLSVRIIGGKSGTLFTTSFITLPKKHMLDPISN